jgi:hypothetical protein
VYVSLREELRKMLGTSLYDQVAAYLDARRAATPPPVQHPAETHVSIGLTKKRAKRQKKSRRTAPRAD